MEEIETDYLVVGAGATGMAFTDALIADSDAEVVMADKRHRPGGHWNDAYPFVRLHQPSALYGVYTRSLGEDRIDETGPNAGCYERATAAEICDYYGRVLDEQLVPSGQVRFLGLHEYLGNDGGEHQLRSRLTGALTTVRVRRRLVDATYMESALPSTSSPPFSVDDDARVVTPNELVSLPDAVSELTVVGAGKTAMDTCYWLVENGVDPDHIRWIRPRDGWTNDRAAIQPLRLVGAFAQWVAAMNEAAAAATDVRDFCLRLESSGVLKRLDPDIEPGFYRGAILGEHERATLRTIGRVVRMGRVRGVGARSIELEEGEIGAEPGHVCVDCTAAGLASAPNRTIFEDDRITAQWIQNGIAPFSAALIGWVEANRDDDEERNRLCPPNGFTPQADARNLARQWAVTQRAWANWMSEPDLNGWLGGCRLTPLGRANEYLDEPAIAALTRMLEHRDAAVENLERLVAEDSASSTA